MNGGGFNGWMGFWQINIGMKFEQPGSARNAATAECTFLILKCVLRMEIALRGYFTAVGGSYSRVAYFGRESSLLLRAGVPAPRPPP